MDNNIDKMNNNDMDDHQDQFDEESESWLDEQPYVIPSYDSSNELKSYKSLLPLCIVPAAVAFLPYILISRMNKSSILLMGVASIVIMLVWFRIFWPKYNDIKKHNENISHKK